ncbi:hypothetical protein [Janthinobacterium sp. HLX7-2]
MQALPSIRSRISWLVLACAIPSVLVLLLLAQSYTRERDHVDVSETY